MKRIFIISILFCLALLTACAVYDDYVASGDEADEDVAALAENTNSTYGDLSYEYLQAIAGDIGYREPGSEEEAQTAEYIQIVFEEIGYTVEMQDFTAYDEEWDEEITSANVIAFKQGSSDEFIVVGAHYDAAYEDGTSGADDNASGVAVMLEAAQLVYNVETPYSIAFVAFGSEELNLDGSTYYVDNLSDDELASLVGMVNLDSLIAGDNAYVYGNEGFDSMYEFVLGDADALGFDLEGKTDEALSNSDGTPCECADYDAFENEEIPFVFFESTNWELSPDAMVQVDPEYGVDGEIRHTEYDTIDYLEENFPGRIEERLNLYVTLVYDLLTQYE